MQKNLIGYLICFLTIATAMADEKPYRLRTVVEHTAIAEMSGMVKSRRYDDVYWVHNDSGDEPRIFAINSDAKVIFPDYLSVSFHGEIAEANKVLWPGHRISLADNYDWEDIAIDDDFLYIADLGNNSNARRDMGVYVLYEPNPRAVESSRIFKYLPVRYPEQSNYPAEQWHYDSEATFTAGGKLYFLTKHRQAGHQTKWDPGVDLYRLDTTHTDEMNVLKKVDSLLDLSLATGADLSPDGNHLAVISYTGLWVFDKPGRSSRWLSGKHRMIPLNPAETMQVEAVCWVDNETILFTNEQRQIFETRLSLLPYSP